MSFDCLRISWRSFSASACFFLSSFASAASAGVEAKRAIEKISRLTVAILMLCAPLLEVHPRSSPGSGKPSRMAGRALCAPSALRVLVYGHGLRRSVVGGSIHFVVTAFEQAERHWPER